MLHDAASLIQSDKIVAENQDYFLQESSEEILLAPIKSDLSKNVKKKLPTQQQSKEKIPADVLSIIKVMGYENFKTIQLPESKFWDDKSGKAVRDIPDPERLLKSEFAYNSSPSQNLSMSSDRPCGTTLNKPFTPRGPSNRLESLELVNATPQEIVRKFSVLQNQGEVLFRKTSELAQNIERFLSIQNRQEELKKFAPLSDDSMHRSPAMNASLQQPCRDRSDSQFAFVSLNSRDQSCSSASSQVLVQPLLGASADHSALSETNQSGLNRFLSNVSNNASTQLMTKRDVDEPI